MKAFLASPEGGLPSDRPRTATRAVQVGLIGIAPSSPSLGLPDVTTGLLATVGLYAIAVIGLNIMFGYGGMLSLGNAIFLGIGGYSVGIGVEHWGWPVLGSIIFGTAVSAVCAVLVGTIIVRLSGHYFAVGMLGLATAFAALVTAFPGLTGGGSGLEIASRLSLGFTTIADDTSWYWCVVVVMVLAVLLFDRLIAGKRGRLFRMTRQDELVASVLGVPVFWTKLLLYTLGAALTGLAGALLFVRQGLIVPTGVGVVTSVELLGLLVIGGLGYRFGGAIGAFLVLWLQALLSEFGSYELVIYGGVFLLVVFFLHGGIEGAIVTGWRAALERRRPGQRTAADAGGEERSGAGAMGSSRTPVGGPLEGSYVEIGPSAPDRDGTGRGSFPVQSGAAMQGEGATGLEVVEACKRFGGVSAVRDVSLRVRRGAVTALIGPNGAGKSTLINLISGVEQLDSGRILLDGEDITSRPPAYRTMRGMVRTFQVPRLVDDLSVVENVVLGREASERPVLWRSKQRESAALQEAAQLLGTRSLGSLSLRPARSLGTGERKYVEILRAVFCQASVLLLDEPAVGLSLEEIDELCGWLSSMRANGTGILVIDHNMDFVNRLADHVYVMDNGSITFSGQPADLIRAGETNREAGGRPGSLGLEMRK